MSENEYLKPLPQADPTTLPFWDSVKAHAMQVQFCADCGNGVFYPRGTCPHCFSKNLEWRPVSGRGTLHTFTVAHRHFNPGFSAEIPYVVALVDLDEGVRMMSNLIDVEPDPAKIAIGMPVEVVYDDVTENVTLPKFRPA